MTFAATNQRLMERQRSVPVPKKVEPAQPATPPQTGQGVRPAEGKKGETPDKTHKLQKLLAAKEKSMRKEVKHSAASDSDTDDSEDD